MQLLLVSIRAAAHTTTNRMAKENFPLKYIIERISKYLLNLCKTALSFRTSEILTSSILLYIGYHWFWLSWDCDMFGVTCSSSSLVSGTVAPMATNSISSSPAIANISPKVTFSNYGQEMGIFKSFEYLIWPIIYY